MLTTADAKLAQTASSLRDHGATRSDLHRHESQTGFLLADYPMLGFNYRMTDIQGALGCAQMSRAETLLQARAHIACAYDSLLRDVSWLQRPVVPDDCVHAYQAYVSLFAPEEPSLLNVERLGRRRNALMTRLEEAGIATRQGTHAPVLTEYYARKYHIEPDQYPNAWIADRLSLALPLYPQMTESEQHFVVASLTASTQSTTSGI
jgi:dTDP-4-amino-4,6-dideoxygalactose transaminase